MPSTALVRKPSPAFVRALSKHPQKNQIDYQLASEQHHGYTEALKRAGAKVVALEPLADFPDSPFVEDTAVIFDSQAIICRMKEESRSGEVTSVADAITNLRPLHHLQPPATLDGGDVLITEHAVFVGQSTRTNKEAAVAMQAVCGKPCIPVTVLRGLHLKSAVSFLGRNLLVIDAESIDPSPFKSFDWIAADTSDRYAANCLALGEFVILPAGYPRLADQIRAHGFKPIEIEMSEFEKADGGVTCLSLIIPESGG